MRTLLRWTLFSLVLLGVAGDLLLVHALILREPEPYAKEYAAVAPLAFPTSQTPLGERYLDLLKRRLVRFELDGKVRTRPVVSPLNDWLAPTHLEIVQADKVPQSAFENGSEYPAPEQSETMIGLRRLTQLQEATRDVLARGVPGDFIECGVWRGGACILMRAALDVYGDKQRCVWAADSFEGLPRPNVAAYPRDAWWSKANVDVASSLSLVKRNFEMYGWLDDRVKFLPGWFKDTLPAAPIEHLAILRIDADMYEGTREALQFLYPKLSPGGIVIVDDYAVPTCKPAVDDYRREHHITEPINRVDWTGIFWQKANKP